MNPRVCSLTCARIVLVAVCCGWFQKTLHAQTNPWTDLFGENLFRANKSRVRTDEIRDTEIIAIYFSAQWCPPCRAFTPKLVDVANRLRKEDKSFDVIFVSSDRSEKDMFGYMREYRMPWLAVPHQSEIAQALSRRFGIRGIPALIVMNRDGNVVSTNARGAVDEKGAQAYAEWAAHTTPKPKDAEAAPPATEESPPKANPDNQPEIRTWTAITGQTIEAALVQEVGAYVELRNADGESAKVLQSQLSPADRDYIQQQRRP